MAMSPSSVGSSATRLVFPLSSSKPTVLPLHFEKSALTYEYAVRYLEVIGATPTPENCKLLLKLMPLSACDVTTAYRSRGCLMDALVVTAGGANGNVAKEDNRIDEERPASASMTAFASSRAADHGKSAGHGNKGEGLRASSTVPAVAAAGCRAAATSTKRLRAAPSNVTGGIRKEEGEERGETASSPNAGGAVRTVMRLSAKTRDTNGKHTTKDQKVLRPTTPGANNTPDTRCATGNAATDAAFLKGLKRRAQKPRLVQRDDDEVVKVEDEKFQVQSYWEEEETRRGARNAMLYPPNIDPAAILHILSGFCRTFAFHKFDRRLSNVRNSRDSGSNRGIAGARGEKEQTSSAAVGTLKEWIRCSKTVSLVGLLMHYAYWNLMLPYVIVSKETDEHWHAPIRSARLFETPSLTTPHQGNNDDDILGVTGGRSGRGGGGRCRSAKRTSDVSRAAARRSRGSLMEAEVAQNIVPLTSEEREQLFVAVIEEYNSLQAKISLTSIGASCFLPLVVLAVRQALESLLRGAYNFFEKGGKDAVMLMTAIHLEITLRFIPKSYWDFDGVSSSVITTTSAAAQQSKNATPGSATDEEEKTTRQHRDYGPHESSSVGANTGMWKKMACATSNAVDYLFSSPASPEVRVLMTRKHQQIRNTQQPSTSTSTNVAWQTPRNHTFNTVPQDASVSPRKRKQQQQESHEQQQHPHHHHRLDPQQAPRQQQQPPLVKPRMSPTPLPLFMQENELFIKLMQQKGLRSSLARTNKDFTTGLSPIGATVRAHLYHSVLQASEKSRLARAKAMTQIRAVLENVQPVTTTDVAQRMESRTFEKERMMQRHLTHEAQRQRQQQIVQLQRQHQQRANVAHGGRRRQPWIT